MKGRRHGPRGPSGPVKGRSTAAIAGNGRVRCTATNRQGQQCGRSPILGGTVCRMHGGAAPQVRAAARERLSAMAPKALTRLDELMDRREFPTVQLQAARFVVEQEVGKAHEHVDMRVEGDWEKLAARIQQVRLRSK